MYILTNEDIKATIGQDYFLNVSSGLYIFF